MVSEYAVDPEVFDDCGSFYAFWNQIGPSNGRLISEVPKKWREKAFNTLRQTLPPGNVQDKTRLEGWLKSRVPPRGVKERFWCGRDLSDVAGVSDWLSKIRIFHQHMPFRGIVCKSRQFDSKYLVTLDQVRCDDPDCPAWKVEVSDFAIPREAQYLALALEPLLALSRVIKFVDPYLYLTETRYRKTVTAVTECFLRRTAGLTGRHIEIHCSNDIRVGGQRLTAHDMEQGLATYKRNVKGDLAGVEVKLCIWEEKPGHQRFQDRFVITDIAGIEIKHDLSEGAPTDKWRLNNLGDNCLMEGWLSGGEFRLVNPV